MQIIYDPEEGEFPCPIQRFHVSKCFDRKGGGFSGGNSITDSAGVLIWVGRATLFDKWVGTEEDCASRRARLLEEGGPGTEGYTKLVEEHHGELQTLAATYMSDTCQAPIGLLIQQCRAAQSCLGGAKEDSKASLRGVPGFESTQWNIQRTGERLDLGVVVDGYHRLIGDMEALVVGLLGQLLGEDRAMELVAQQRAPVSRDRPFAHDIPAETLTGFSFVSDKRNKGRQLAEEVASAVQKQFYFESATVRVARAHALHRYINTYQTCYS